MTRSALAAVLLALLLGACAQSPGGAQGPRRAGDEPAPASSPAPPPRGTAADLAEEGDPLEPLNRDILRFNLALDDCCIKPVALAYRDLFGPWVRTRIRNVADTIQEPRFAANSLLQGRPLDAGESAMRFVINATLGLGGMFDMAQFGGPARKERDFGQTLHVWGLPAGPYLMLPVLGPSNPRDTAGMIADGFLNPINWLMPIWGSLARGVVDGIDARERTIEALDALRAESLDFYARLRSIWRQQRAAELGRVTAEGEGLDVLEDPGAAPAR